METRWTGFWLPFPTLLQGTRCYTDASTPPDLQRHHPRDAGLGVFIVNTQVNPPLNIFIKAAMKVSSSVLMAETAAIALAARVLQSLQMQQCTILTNSQQLVHFINGNDLEHPPDWRIKPYTQIISSSAQASSIAICKIKRRQNQMTDLLARQASSAIQSNETQFTADCINTAHVQECPLLMALQKCHH
jgi:ribonuclease HI